MARGLACDVQDSPIELASGWAEGSELGDSEGG